MILDAATTVFTEQGYEAGSIDAIGARMGISGPAIYRHFARKQDIVVELLVKAVAGAVAELEEHGGDDRIAVLAAGFARRAAAERAVLALLHANLPDLDTANRARIAEARDRLLERWADALHRHRPGLDPAGCRLRVLACFATVGVLSAAEASSDTIEHLLLALLLA